MAGSALIVEDHPLFRSALTALMQGVFGEAATLAAASAEEGLRCAAQAGDLRLVLLDMGLPGLSGLEAVGAFRRACPDTAIVAVSASEDRREVDAALRLGVRAFVSKAMPTEAIVGVVQRVLRDATSPPEWVKPRPRAELAPTLPELTPRQREILALLCDGHGNKEIGLRLSLAENTVKQHVSALFRALGVVNRTQAVLVARHLGVAPSAPDDDAPLPEVLAQLHTTLYSLGRLTEADEVFQRIEQSAPADLVLLAGVTGTQVRSLTNRGRHEQALALGLAMLAQLGLDVPAEVAAEVAQRFDALLRWAAEADPEADLRRPEPSDPLVLAAAELINLLVAPAFYWNQTVMAWLVLESQRLWDAHGPCSPLVATLSITPVVTLTLRGDYRLGRSAARRAVEVGHARGCEPGASRARYCCATFSQQWFEPIEDVLRDATTARERLLERGDQQWAGFCYATTVTALFDCAPTLDAYEREIEQGIAFTTRTSQRQVLLSLLAHRQLARCLRGTTGVAACFDDEGFDSTAHHALVSGNPVPLARWHLCRAQAAAIFGDAAQLAGQVRRTLENTAYLRSAQASLNLLHALVLADETLGADASAAFEQLESHRAWFAQRAADAPFNYQHLALWVDAERAWVHGDVRSAECLFDAALLAAESRVRPWHRALATERAARLQRALGHERAARGLLAEACELYAAWGAHGKVEAMRREHDFLSVDRAVAR